MYTNKERWLKSLDYIHSELFIEYKGFWVGNKGTIYNSKKRHVKARMFRVDEVQTRASTFILEAWGCYVEEPCIPDKRVERTKLTRPTKPIKKVEITEPIEVIELTKVQKRRNKNKGYRIYRRRVDELTNLQPLHIMKDFDKREFGKYNVDHIIPVRYCYDKGMSEEECADISNLQILTHKDNTDKCMSMYCILEQCEHLKKL